MQPKLSTSLFEMQLSIYLCLLWFVLRHLYNVRKKIKIFIWYLRKIVYLKTKLQVFFHIFW